MKTKHVLASAALVLAAVLTAASGGHHSYESGVMPTVIGTLNPQVTQQTIHSTICKTGWTATVRPPVSFTNKIKNDLASSLHVKAADFELDHAISIELGGAPSSINNLWMQSYNIPLGARQKDVVETYLKNEVCKGEITLEQAQRAVMSDWPAIYQAKKGILPNTEDSDE